MILIEIAHTLFEDLFTIHIHIQNAQTNCEGLHSVRLFKINIKFIRILINQRMIRFVLP